MLQPVRTSRLQAVLVTLAIDLAPLLLFLTALFAAPPPRIALALLLCGLVLGVLALRRHGVFLVGPLFLWDLVQLARRGRGALVRVLYLLVLFVGLGAVYRENFAPGDLSEFLFGSGQGASLTAQAQFAERFTMVFLFLQTIAVLVLTPIYLGTVINEDRARGVLDHLSTTQLSLREIAVGKLLSRAVHLGGILLTGLPVLALVMLWGGVDPNIVVAAFATTAITLVSTGSLCLLCSTATRRPSTALWGSYGLLLALAGVPEQLGGLDLYAISPIGILIAMPLQAAQVAAGVATAPTLPAMVAHFSVFHGLLALFCLTLTVYRLRYPPEGRRPLRTSILGDAPALPTGRAPVAPLVVSPPIGEDAYFWKEVLHNSGSDEQKFAPTGAFYKTFFLILCPLVILTRYLEWAWPAVWPAYANTLALTLRLLGTAWAMLGCAIVGFRAASCLCGERERRTLDGLLVLPRDPNDLLRAKGLGCLLRVRHAAYALAALWALGVCTSILHPAALPLLAIAVFAYAVFLTGVGLWVSSVCRTALRACVAIALLLLIVAMGPWLGVLFLGGRPRWGALSPPAAWWTLAFSWVDVERAGFRGTPLLTGRLTVPLVGALGFALVGFLFLILARRRFTKGLFGK